MASLDDIRRQALEDGDELVINGRSFNRSRTVVPPAPRPKIAVVPAQPKPELPAAPAAITAEDLSRLLAERDTAWKIQSDMVAQAFGRAIDSLPQPAANPPSRWVFTPKYNERGAIETLTAEPLFD